MKKIIKLEVNSGRLLDREPFLMAENEVLEIEFATHFDEQFLVCLKNGDTKLKLCVKNSFEVPKELYKVGMLEITVSLYKGGVMVRNWDIEPINIIEHESKFIWLPILEGINMRLEKAEQTAQRLKGYEDRILVVENEIKELTEVVFDPLN